MKILLILILLSFTACGNKYVLDIDSIKSPDYIEEPRNIYIKAGHSYKSGNVEDISNNNLEFKKYKEYLKRALTELNYFVSDNMNNSDGILVIDYGLSTPQKNIISKPIYGQTGISSSSYTSSCISNYCSGSTNYIPKNGITGYKTETEITYTKNLNLTLYRKTKNNSLSDENILWKTDIISSGSSNDLKLIIPYLIAGSIDIIGKDLDSKKTVTIYENDERVKIIKGLNIIQQ
jgi:hypothetical protein